MDFPRRIAWRVLLATATVGLAVAGLGGACAAQDDRDAGSQGYQGPYLGWTGKAQPAPRPQDAPPPVQEEAAPPPARVEASPTAQVEASPTAQSPAAQSPAAQSEASSNELFPSYASERDAAPSRYGPERSQPAAESAPPPAQAYRAPAAEAPPTQAPPAAEAAAEPPISPPPAIYRQAANTPLTAPASGDTSVRFYSVHRQYGMTPDPIPEPAEGHTVLIGPPDHAAAADSARDDDQGQDADQADSGRADSGASDADQGGVGEDVKPPAGKPHHASQSGDH